MENKMKEVAKLLGVAIGEEFDVVEYEDHSPYCLHMDCGLVDCGGECSSKMLVHLLMGRFTIKRIPFKPNYGDDYYCVTSLNGTVSRINWKGYIIDYYCYNANNCFRTFEEITEEDIQRIVKEMKGPYEKEDK